MNEPKPCPQCRSTGCGPIRCRFTGLEHPKPELQPAPFDLFGEIARVTEAFYGKPGSGIDRVEPDDDFDPRYDEDEYLDDPRRGQAAGINRDNRGRE